MALMQSSIPSPAIRKVAGREILLHQGEMLVEAGALLRDICQEPSRAAELTTQVFGLLHLQEQAHQDLVEDLQHRLVVPFPHEDMLNVSRQFTRVVDAMTGVASLVPQMISARWSALTAMGKAAHTSAHHLHRYLDLLMLGDLESGDFLEFEAHQDRERDLVRVGESAELDTRWDGNGSELLHLLSCYDAWSELTARSRDAVRALQRSLLRA